MEESKLLGNKIRTKANTGYFDTLCEYSVRAVHEWLSANAQDKANPTPTEIKVAREVANFEVYDIEPSQWVLDWLEDSANE